MGGHIRLSQHGKGPYPVCDLLAKIDEAWQLSEGLIQHQSWPPELAHCSSCQEAAIGYW